MVEIIEYKEEHHEDFRKLNLAWLEEYDLVESHDLMVLNDPRGTILDQGGFIWLAKEGNEIIGSAALMKKDEGLYELAKMSVTKKWQGKGISKLLLETCMNKAKEIGAVKLLLFSNHQLRTALKLYEKYGFKNIELKDSPFETADVKMELVF
jgi:N-acetylglutamate synthase-like GNAT family acetyltransferase